MPTNYVTSNGTYQNPNAPNLKKVPKAPQYEHDVAWDNPIPVTPSFGYPEEIVQTKENYYTDFSQKYKGTYVLASCSKWHGQVVFIDSLSKIPEENPGKNFYVNCMPESGYIEEIKFDDFKVVTSLPKSGYVNTPSGAVFFSRVPERQWRRGLCCNTMLGHALGENCVKIIRAGFKNTIFVPPKGKPIGCTFRPEEISFEIAKNLYFPTYPSYRQAHKEVSTNIISKAFTQDFALCLSPSSENLSLFREYAKLAEVDFKNPNLVYIKEPLFHQEISDLFRRIDEPEVQLILS